MKKNLTIYSRCSEVWFQGAKPEKWMKKDASRFEKNVLPQIHDISVCEVTGEDMREAQKRILEKTQSPWLANESRKAAIHFFNYALRKCLRKGNPAVEMPRYNTTHSDGPVEVYSQKEWLRLLMTMEKMPDADICRFQMLSGLDMDDIREIRGKDVLEDGNRLRVGGKASDLREIRVPKTAADILKERTSSGEMEDRIFALAEEKEEEKRILAELRCCIQKDSGVREYSFRRCTDHFAMCALSAGATLADLRYYLGCRTESSVMKYQRGFRSRESIENSGKAGV